MSYTDSVINERPTRVRFGVLAAMTVASFMLYLHRAFIAEILKYKEIRCELRLR